jgi:hypothetical protein
MAFSGLFGGNPAGGGFAAYVSFGMRWPGSRLTETAAAPAEPRIIDVEAVRIDPQPGGAKASRSGDGRHGAGNPVDRASLAEPAPMRRPALAPPTGTVKPANDYARYAPARPGGLAPRLLTASQSLGQHLDVMA